ncbi:Tumor necrosis factor alpha-induced protein 8-like protein [Trachymyrmex zeteki]|uniref:Tumor necrosis factor alpha-induced protein 8-like protein n=1 Tax=Mycetomoellerius zeteki TaxID=64791 RepID=A0A151XJ45_9HYME|nr:Tumor necrosis factor alpha-induced protein 8-like protein [Trachymyrmex zeteki]
MLKNIYRFFCKSFLKFLQVAWGTAVMELQSWLLYHLVAVTDCNQGSEDSPFIVYVCLSLPGHYSRTIVASLFNLPIGLVQRSHQFRSNDAEKLEEIREALGTVVMTVVSFYEVDYSYDQEYLTGSMERCRTLLQQLIKPHLTDKSSQRCDQVFDFLAYPKFLDSVFRYDSEHRPILGMLVSDLNKALDARRL